MSSYVHNISKCPPIFIKFLNVPPISAKSINFLSIFVQFTIFCLICVFWHPPIMAMMHLCIMLYTFSTPLHADVQMGNRRPMCIQLQITLRCYDLGRGANSTSRMYTWYNLCIMNNNHIVRETRSSFRIMLYL